MWLNSEERLFFGGGGALENTPSPPQAARGSFTFPLSLHKGWGSACVRMDGLVSSQTQTLQLHQCLHQGGGASLRSWGSSVRGGPSNWGSSLTGAPCNAGAACSEGSP